MSTMRECLDMVVLARGLDDVVVLDNLDDALIGFDTEAERAIYDYHKIIAVYTDQGMDPDEATEFYEYNLVRALPYMGDKPPIIALMFDGPDWDG
jgi:hypothetical protein